ncbi:hypothetical protein BDV19DRAFT_384349 [Aspergillus venezuelensis]
MSTKDNDKIPKQTGTIQSISPSSTPSQATATTETGSAQTTHKIKVGPKSDPHRYVPHEVKADVGDVIVFEFYPRNHSVVQADFRAPCMPADGDYFFSGIKNDFEEVNGQVVGDLPTWNWTVKNKDPTFFYCTGADSCIINGMVGVINPNKTHDWKTQNTAALKAPYMLLPGQSMPAEGNNAGTGTSATHASDSSSSTSPKLDTSSPHMSEPSSLSSGSSSSSYLSSGAIAGIVIGAVAVVAILGVLLFLLGRNRVYRKWLSSSKGGGSAIASSGKDMRTAKWALAASVATVPPSGGGGGGDGSGNNGNRMSVIGTNQGPQTGLGLGMGVGPGSAFPHTSMERTNSFMPAQTQAQQQPPQSGIFSPESLYGYPTPTPTGSQMQGPRVQSVQHPYWIWDQSIQPSPLNINNGKQVAGGPSELEGEGRR